MLRPNAFWSIVAALIGSANIGAAHAEVRPALTVFGPPSFERSLQQIDAIFTRATGQAVVLSVAPSAKLEQLVEHGERPDVIIATAHRLSRLSHEGLVRPKSTEALASVHLVLVEPKGAHVPLRSIYPGFPIGPVLGPYGKIAVPNAEGSAAGSRAMTALISLGGWLGIATRIIQEPSSQDALNAIASGEAILAVAYDSDAEMDPEVRILSYFPEDTYPRVEYGAAEAAQSQGVPAAKFLAFLRGPEATDILRRQGFAILGEQGHQDTVRVRAGLLRARH